VKSQRVLNGQLAFLKNVPQPLRVHMPIFKSNRIWFIRNRLNFVTVSEPPPSPRMILHHTSTRVALPPAFQPEADLNPKIRKEWEKRSLLEL
jgi:hypothetical protein